MSASSGSERKPSLKSQDSCDSDPPVVMEMRGKLGENSRHPPKSKSEPRQSGKRRKERSKVKARSLPIDIKFKKKA